MSSAKRLTDPFGARSSFRAPQGEMGIYRLSQLEKEWHRERFPPSILHPHSS